MKNKDILHNLVVALLAVVIGAPLAFCAVMGLFYFLAVWITGMPLPAQD